MKLELLEEIILITNLKSKAHKQTNEFVTYIIHTSIVIKDSFIIGSGDF